MALVCNIDRKGKRLRVVSGVLFAAVGLGVLILSWPPGLWAWLLAIGLILVGGFQIFEGVVGWCAVRALGFRTRF